jgi:hypothetical protein
MLEALEVNLEQGTVQVDLSKLYENIDLPETLSNLTGKWIRRIDPDPNDSRVPAACRVRRRRAGRIALAGLASD